MREDNSTILKTTTMVMDLNIVITANIIEVIIITKIVATKKFLFISVFSLL